ncbi:MAG TPA: alpha-L-fucosidase [Chitinophagaceae bacterium]|nr:alpha-L-fucosidase [Chitinophagaceae bacterium]
MSSYAQRSIPIPNKKQLAWQKAELGVLISYDLHVFDGKRYGQGLNRLTPVADHNIFSPTQLNAEQWVLAAKAAGAKFAIITATHETGFAIYQSDVNPYCMKALKWRDGKGDIVKEFVDACRKHGILPGIYVGIRWNSLLGVHDFVVDGSGKMKELRQAYYNKMVEGMVKEICTNYGELFEIWFDGGAGDTALGAPNVLPIVQKFQPNCLFYWSAQLSEARWGGSESGTVGYPCWSNFPYPSMMMNQFPEIRKNDFHLAKHGDSTGSYYLPAMADAPLRGYKGRHEWFWEPGDEDHLFPVDALVNMYEKSVGRNATLILGLTPDTAGLIPAPDVIRLKEFGDAISAKYGKALANGNDRNEIIFKTTQQIRSIMICEDISYGQRVKKFKVQALVGGKWTNLIQGSSVGHKFIYELPAPLRTKKLRLIIEDAFDTPIVKSFSVF